MINNNFSFDFICKAYPYKKNDNLVAKIIVHPEIDRFNYFLLVEENQKVKCRIKLYCGLTNLFYYSDLFSIVKWISMNELIITGKAKDVEICITVNECKITFTNLTKYQKSPYFEMMRGDISKSEREIAHLNWLHSLPPSQAAFIRERDN